MNPFGKKKLKACGLCRKTTNCRCGGTPKKKNEQLSLFAPSVSVKRNDGKGTLPSCGSCGAFLTASGNCRNVTCKHH